MIKNDLHFATKTVFLHGITFLSWLTCLMLYAFDFIPVFPSLILITILSYISFTPMHEATHGNISGRDKSRKWIDQIIGYTSAMPMLIPYPVFKQLHLQHHAHTNDPKLDPDYWVATRNPFLLVLKILTIKPAYYYHVIFKPKMAVKKTRLSIIYLFSIYAFIIYMLDIFTGNGLKVFLMWLSSAVFSLAILAFFFDWLPHTSHDKRGRFVDTKIIHKPWLTYPLLYQNYHLSHHLYPRVPFYNYQKLFFELEEEMREKGSEIII